MSRPELQAPPDIFYGEAEASKYAVNTRMIEIQTSMSERAVELLALPDDGECRLILDIGCGSGLSGEVLTEHGHEWVGIDISRAMLEIAVDRGCDGDVVQQDIGWGLPFRPGAFDAVISISAIQWLFYAHHRDHHPRKRLMAFFQTLYNCMAKGARAVLQFYPETPEQMEMVTSIATRCGFTGGLLVDFPNSTRAKKYFLVLNAGQSSLPLPKAKGLDGEEEEGAEEGEGTVKFSERRRKRGGRRGDHPKAGSRQWVLEQKDRRRRRGEEDVRADSKYTGRKRSGRRKGF